MPTSPARRFYETVAPHVGFRLGADKPERAQFVGASGCVEVVHHNG